MSFKHFLNVVEDWTMIEITNPLGIHEFSGRASELKKTLDNYDKLCTSEVMSVSVLDNTLYVHIV